MALKAIAKKNTSVVKKSGREEAVLKEGTPLEHSNKHLNQNSVGMSIGVTKNMGDYESLRVDVWLTDEVKDGEDYKDAYERVFAVVDETIDAATVAYMEMWNQNK